MNRLIIFLFLIVTQKAFAQENSVLNTDQSKFHVQIFYRDACDGHVIKAEHFSLIKNGRSYSSDNGICVVLQKGFYIVESEFENLGIDSIYIQKHNQIDTILFHKIRIERYSGIPPWPYYSCCGNPCEGEVCDNWPSGNIKIQGKFKNGRILRMTKYSINGIIESKLAKSKFSYTFCYYEKGNLVAKMWECRFLGYSKYWDFKKNRFRRRIFFNAVWIK